MAANSALIATVAAATLVAAFAPSIQSASADTTNGAKFVRCLANPISVTAVGHGILGVDKRVSKVAIANWQQAAQQSIGNYYSDWGRSLGARVDCHRSVFEVTCVATATPCRS